MSVSPMIGKSWNCSRLKRLQMQQINVAHNPELDPGPRGKNCYKEHYWDNWLICNMAYRFKSVCIMSILYQY